MEEKCFCHFNGYEVKDAAARKEVQGVATRTAALESAMKDAARVEEVQEVANRASALESKNNLLESRMNTFASMEEGSTTGDAELIDARVGVEGTIYDSVGDAMRSQFERLHNLAISYPLVNAKYDTGKRKFTQSTTLDLGVLIPVYAEETTVAMCLPGYQFRVIFFESEDPTTFISRTEAYYTKYVIPKGTYYSFRFVKASGETIVPADGHFLVGAKVYDTAHIDEIVEQINEKLETITLNSLDNRRTLFGTWESGAINKSTGGNNNSGSMWYAYIRTDFVDVSDITGNITLEVLSDLFDGSQRYRARIFQYDADKAFISYTEVYDKGEYPFTLNGSTKYLRYSVGDIEGTSEASPASLSLAEYITVYKKSELTERIEVLEGKTAALENVPANVYEDEVEATVAAVHDVIAHGGERGFLVFCVFTDLHHDPKYAVSTTADMMANIKALHDRLQFDAIFNLGDTIDGKYYDQKTAEKLLAEVNSAARAITPNYYVLEGNHDDNRRSLEENYGGYPSSEKLTNLELYTVLQRGNPNLEHSIGNIDGRFTDFFVDFPKVYTRVICLSADYTTFTDQTNRWLEEVLADAHDKYYSVLVMSHCATKAEWGFDGDINNGDLIEDPIRQFVDNDGHFMGYINGHTHGDIMATADDISWTEVSIGCAKFETKTSGTPGAVYQNRSVANHTKVLFDVVVVNKETDEIHFVRFGAGSDRVVYM